MTSTSGIGSTFATLLNPIISLYSTNVTSLIAFIKTSLHKYTFLALTAYEHLLAIQSRWENLLSFRGSSKDTTEFKEGLTTLRGICMRSFPEFLADVKMASIPKPNTDLSTDLAEFTISVGPFSVLYLLF